MHEGELQCTRYTFCMCYVTIVLHVHHMCTVNGHLGRGLEYGDPGLHQWCPIPVLSILALALLRGHAMYMYTGWPNGVSIRLRYAYGVWGKQIHDLPVHHDGVDPPSEMPDRPVLSRQSGRRATASVMQGRLPSWLRSTSSSKIPILWL